MYLVISDKKHEFVKFLVSENDQFLTNRVSESGYFLHIFCSLYI